MTHSIVGLLPNNGSNTLLFTPTLRTTNYMDCDMSKFGNVNIRLLKEFKSNNIHTACY